jgi:hypothetical protein
MCVLPEASENISSYLVDGAMACVTLLLSHIHLFVGGGWSIAEVRRGAKLLMAAVPYWRWTGGACSG